MMEQSPLRLWEEKIFTFPRFKDLHFSRMYIFLEKLDNPHLKLPPIIHVAGTNGKGSSIAFLKNILACHNYQFHVFTSPHLITLNERFVFANQMAKDEEILSLIEEIDAIKGNMDCTWFEFLTLIAILGFSRIKADFCLIETGLGGLYDATNIIPNPLLTLITSISLDHQEHLGKNLEDIANKKRVF